MKKLRFERRKYGKELLIDACNETELDIVADTLVLDFYTILFLEKGSGVYYLDTELIPFEDHLLLFIKPGQVNRVDQVVFEKCHLLFFEGDFLDEFFNDRNFIFKFGYFHHPDLPSYLKLEADQFRVYYNLAKELRAEIHNQSVDSVHILRSIVYYLLVRLNQAYAKVYGTAYQTLADPTVLSFLRLLKKNIRENRRVSVFAKELKISRVKLNSLCQEHFGKTAQQLIREQAIAEIKKSLKYSDRSISEIAYAFNFPAPSHFSRFVKQMTGLSPQEFRNSLSKW